MCQSPLSAFRHRIKEGTTMANPFDGTHVPDETMRDTAPIATLGV